MSGVQHYQVKQTDADMRLDRWLEKRFPHLSRIQIQKMIRTGQVRIDSKRIKANHRLEAGQDMRIPPIPKPSESYQSHTREKGKKAVILSDKDVAALHALF